MLNVKALAVLDCRAYITETFGTDAHEKIRAVMRARHRDIVYADDLTPLTWIDLEAVVQHAIAVDDVLGDGTSATMLQYLATKHFTGVYRIMFQSATPKDVVRKIASIWSRYYDKGEASVEFADDNHATSRIRDCPDVPKGHERLLIPYMKTVLSLSGVREVSIQHTQCAANGADHCVFQYSWA